MKNQPKNCKLTILVIDCCNSSKSTSRAKKYSVSQLALSSVASALAQLLLHNLVSSCSLKRPGKSPSSVYQPFVKAAPHTVLHRPCCRKSSGAFLFKLSTCQPRKTDSDSLFYISQFSSFQLSGFGGLQADKQPSSLASTRNWQNTRPPFVLLTGFSRSFYEDSYLDWSSLCASF